MSDIFSKALIEKYKNHMLAKQGFYISSEIAQRDLESLTDLYLLLNNITSSSE